MFRAVIMGAPASGKGTISSRIVKYFNVEHLSSGDVLRSQILSKTALGLKVEQYVNSGNLVPDDIMEKLVDHELNRLSGSNWLLDGFPRTKHQAELLLKKYSIVTVLNLVVPFEVIVKRVESRWIHPGSGRVYNMEYSPPKIKGFDDLTGEPLVQRPDDQPEAVRKRLEIYAETVQPLLDFYKKHGILNDFHGKTSDEIWPKVSSFMSHIMQLKSKDENVS